jgi:hypothetical protein
MAGEKFYLNFVSDGFGEIQIDEPIGYTTLSWDFKQKDKGYGRDILFNSGEAEMEFSYMRNHYLDKILYYYHHYGYESKVEMKIVFSNGVTVIHDLDFAKATTDDFRWFKCKMAQRSDVLIVKRKSETKVDLFSDKDIYGNPITPIQTTKILMKPKSIVQKSQLRQVDFEGVYMERKGKGSEYFQANPCQIIVQDEIQDTLISLYPSDSWKRPSNYYIIEAVNNMTNTRVVINKGLYVNCRTGQDRGNGYVDLKLYCVYGRSEDSGTWRTLFSTTVNISPDETFTMTTTKDYVIDIPFLQRSDKIWVYFEWKVRQSRDLSAGKAYCRTTIRNMEINVSTVASTTSSISEGIRLIDAVRQVVKSISGLPISAPIFDNQSVYWNTFLLNGNLLRGLKDKPFYLSLEDIEDSITECNADYEIGDTVFFGTEKDFYTPTECWFFDTIQFKEFQKTFNPRMCINQFSYKYKNYQALKENEIPQTADTVHGENTMSFYNKNVENKKEIQIEWVRDGFLFEEARGKALKISEKTVYQDDNKIFAIDTIIQTANQTYSETAELLHNYDAVTRRLTLKSATINFALLGIEVNTTFTIKAPDNNAGTYNVVAVTPANVELTKIAANPTTNNNGVRKTFFDYVIKFTSVPLKNYTTEGFTNIANINDPSSYSNMRFSVRRNIENYFSEYIATCNTYWSDKPVTTTFYKNNPDFKATYQNLTTVENGDYFPTNKLLSPYLYEDVVFANVELADFFTLISAIQSTRGFIRTIDKNGNVIKLYPKSMQYKIPSRELKIIAEEKFEPSQMKISTAHQDIVINDETSLYHIDYEIVEHKLYLFDNHRQRLYNGVFWDKVEINGEFANSEQELDDLMRLIQSIND